MAGTRPDPVISGLMWIALGLQCVVLSWVLADDYGWARLGQSLVALFVQPIALGIAFFAARTTRLRPLMVVGLAGVTIAILVFLPWGAAC